MLGMHSFLGEDILQKFWAGCSASLPAPRAGEMDRSPFSMPSELSSEPGMMVCHS